jgi:hypothetical protein
MKNILPLIIILLCIGCTQVVESPQTKGFVYDSITKQPVNNAKIEINPSRTTSTDASGMFVLPKKTAYQMIAFDSSRDPKYFWFSIEHPAYKTKEIEDFARGSFSDNVKVYDSIFLQRK